MTRQIMERARSGNMDVDFMIHTLIGLSNANGLGVGTVEILLEGCYRWQVQNWYFRKQEQPRKSLSTDYADYSIRNGSMKEKDIRLDLPIVSCFPFLFA